MLFSARHKLIFVKTLKTAGTSIEISISRFLETEADIITPISPEDEVTRLRHHVRPKNWEFAGEPTNARFWNHMSAAQIIERLGQDTWDQCFSFAFERNPWDKCVSMYYWVLQNRPGIGFSDWLLNEQNVGQNGIPLNWPLYTIDDQVVVDMVFRWEDLPEALFVAQKRGEPLIEGEEVDSHWFDGWLPRAKSRFRPPNTPYQLLYDDRTRDWVARVFEQEIEYWGYTFDADPAAPGVDDVSDRSPGNEPDTR